MSSSNDDAVDRRAIQEWDLSHFPVGDIRRAPENDGLYDQFGVANEDDHALALSIHQMGIQEPLTITSDGYLLSGHRRLAAAKYLGLTSVPVRRDTVAFGTMNQQQRLELLRTYNRQREKSPAERVREKLVDIDPKRAYAKLVIERAKASFQPNAVEANVRLGAVKVRSKITTLQFLRAAQAAVEANRAYWPLTDRRIHCLLLNDPPLRHDKKPNSIYRNDHASYKALTSLLVRARLTGDVPMAAVEDSTRPIQLGGGFATFEQFFAQVTQDFMLGYSRDLMQGQPHHVEILLEKNALRSVIESVARDYCIPVTTGRGYSSLSPRADLVRRFRKSGKEKLVLLMLTDFDPDGEEIAASFARSLRDDFGVQSIHPVKVALTARDIVEYDLPGDMDAKPSSPNYNKFLLAHGGKAVELDAAPVAVLQGKLRQAIEGVIDLKAFDAQIELEMKDATYIQAYRQVALDAIAGAAVGGRDDE